MKNYKVELMESFDSGTLRVGVEEYISSQKNHILFSVSYSICPNVNKYIIYSAMIVMEEITLSKL